MRLIILITIVAISLALSACGGVTETGNPVYVNNIFGVEVVYPSEWNIEETEPQDGPINPEPMASEAEVCFSGGFGGTNVCIYMSRLNPEPDSLIAYLQEAYPERDFVTYDTSTLNGYEYDDPDDGSNGGDLREYYFLNGDVFVRVVAELFSGGEAQLTAFLNGIVL